MTNDVRSRFLGQGVAYDWDCDGFVKITKQIEDCKFGSSYLQLTWVKYPVREITCAKRATGVLLSS